MLIARRQPRTARRAEHEQGHGLVGIAGEVVLPETDGEIERDVGVKTGEATM